MKKLFLLFLSLTTLFFGCKKKSLVDNNAKKWWETAGTSSYYEKSNLIIFYLNHSDFFKKLNWDFSYTFENKDLSDSELILYDSYIKLITFMDLEEIKTAATNNPTNELSEKYLYLNEIVRLNYMLFFKKYSIWTEYTAEEVCFSFLNEKAIYEEVKNYNYAAYWPVKGAKNLIFSEIKNNLYNMIINVTLPSSALKGEQNDFPQLLKAFKDMFFSPFNHDVVIKYTENQSIQLMFKKELNLNSISLTFNLIDEMLTEKYNSYLLENQKPDDLFLPSEDYRIVTEISYDQDGIPVDSEIIVINSKSILDNSLIKKVEAVKDPNTMRPSLSIQLTEEGSKQFYNFTNDHIDEKLAIVFKDISIFSAYIRNAIKGTIIIKGQNLSTRMVTKLANYLNQY